MNVQVVVVPDFPRESHTAKAMQTYISSMGGQPVEAKVRAVRTVN